MPKCPEYDVIIIGTGPAGVTATIYSVRFALKTLLVGDAFGGAIARTHIIENYPGWVSGSGMEMMEQWRKNLEHLDVELVEDYVDSITQLKNGKFKVSLDFKGDIETYSIIYATGRKERKLNVKGEDRLVGRGVSYCATCDGPFFKDKIVGVVGGSDSAAKEALYLSNIAKKVYIIYRREKIRAEPINVQRIENCDNIEIINNTNVIEILGKDKVEAVKLDKPYNNNDIFKLDAVFIEIGADPRSEMAKKIGVKTNEKEEIIVDNEMKTNIPGFFAAGDVVNRREKQVIVAAAHGAIAAYSAREFIEHLNPLSYKLK
ncbi:MAG: NAD(P)/FAD-dependent oxidoreductase [Promethearchaeota archaeon]